MDDTQCKGLHVANWKVLEFVPEIYSPGSGEVGSLGVRLLSTRRASLVFN